MNAQHMAYVERDYAYVIKPILDLTVVSNAQDTANFMRTNAFVMRALQERTVNKPRFAKKDAKKMAFVVWGNAFVMRALTDPIVLNS